MKKSMKWITLTVAYHKVYFGKPSLKKTERTDEFIIKVPADFVPIEDKYQYCGRNIGAILSSTDFPGEPTAEEIERGRTMQENFERKQLELATQSEPDENENFIEHMFSKLCDCSEVVPPSGAIPGKIPQKIFDNLRYGNTPSGVEAIGGNPEDDYSSAKADQENL